MKNKIYIPGRDVEPTTNAVLPEKPATELISKDELQNKRIDGSELFSHFTANIIKEKKIFTR